jgi:hypothetical protein
MTALFHRVLVSLHVGEVCANLTSPLLTEIYSWLVILLLYMCVFYTIVPLLWNKAKS